MLREQGPKFACITLPYWDAMAEYADMVDGKCSNIYDCSSIARELGGTLSPGGTVRTMTINGKTVSAPCYETFAGNAYCDDNGKCGCIPRNDLSQQTVPSGSGYTGVFNKIAYSRSFEDFTQQIQTGVHNELHNRVGGFMATFASPGDPLFWSWHTTVDMLLYVYHQCNVPSSMGDDEIRKSIYGFNQRGNCKYTSDAPEVDLNGKLIQQFARDGVELAAAKNPLIGKYFADLEDTIADYVSFRRLGEYAYKYEIPEAFNSQLLQSSELCRTYWEEWKTKGSPDALIKAGSSLTMDEAGKVSAAGAGANYTKVVANLDKTKNEYTFANGTSITNKVNSTTSSLSGSSAGDDFGSSGEKIPMKTSEKKTGSLSSDIDSSVGTPMRYDNSTGNSATPTAVTSVIQTDGKFSMEGSKYWSWYRESRKKLQEVFPGNVTEISRQMDYLGCISFSAKFGIGNFSEEFRTSFKVNQTHPNCQLQVDEVKEGKCEIVLKSESFLAKEVEVKPGVTPAPAVDPADAYNAVHESAKTRSSSDKSTTSGGGPAALSARWSVAVAVGIASAVLFVM